MGFRVATFFQGRDNVASSPSWKPPIWSLFHSVHLSLKLFLSRQFGPKTKIFWFLGSPQVIPENIARICGFSLQGLLYFLLRCESVPSSNKASFWVNAKTVYLWIFRVLTTCQALNQSLGNMNSVYSQNTLFEICSGSGEGSQRAYGLMIVDRVFRCLCEKVNLLGQ